MLEFAVEKRFAVIWLTLLLSATGILLYQRMPLELLPHTQERKYVATLSDSVFPLPVASSKIHESFNDAANKVGAKGSTEIITSKSSVTAIFSPENRSETQFHVFRNELKKALKTTGFNEVPLIFEVSPTSGATMSLIVRASREFSVENLEVSRLVKERVVPRLLRIEGISDVSVSGEINLETTVTPRLAPHAEVGIPLHSTVTALQTSLGNSQIFKSEIAGNILFIPHNNKVPLGERTLSLMKGGSGETEESSLRDQSQLGPKDYKISDLFNIHHRTVDQENFSLLDGNKIVSIDLFKSTTANSVEISNKVQNSIGFLKRDLPHLTISIISDSANYIKDSQENVVDNLTAGILLTCSSIFFFMKNIRSTFIVTLSLPISLLLTFPILYFCNISRNVMSLAGIALGVGVVIDASISVVSATEQNVSLGYAPKMAAIRAARENVRPIALTLLTTFAVFSPIFLIDGTAGDIFYDLSATVIASQVASFFTAILLVPSISSFEFNEKKKENSLARLQTSYSSELKSSTKIFEILDKILRTKLAYWTVSSAFITLVFWSLNISPPTEFLPKSSSAEMRAIVDLGKSTGTELALSIARNLDHKLEEIGAVNRLISRKEHRLVTDFSLDRGNIFQVKEKIIPSVVPFSVQVNPSNPLDLNTSNGSDLGFYIDGSLQRKQQLRKLISSLPGVTHQTWSENFTEPELLLNRENPVLLSMGIPNHAFPTFLTLGFFQFPLAQNLMSDATQQQPPIFYRPSNLATNSPVHPLSPSPLHADVPPGSTEVKVSVARLHFVDGKPYEKVEIALHGKTANEVMKDISQFSKSLGLDVRWDRPIMESQKSVHDLIQAIILAIILTMAVLYSQNRSIISTIIIMFTFIWGAIGSFPGLVLHLENLNSSALVGFILLAGTIVNNGILLMEIISKNRRLQFTPRECCLIAARQRTMPVLVTSLTTVLGMVPMVFETGAGSQMYRGLAIVVVYGTLVSTPVSLIGIPCLVMIFDDVREFIEKWLLRVKVSRVQSA